MAPDERDRIFDKALARHLRADGSSPGTANVPSREFVRAGECPGPETLAAYHERSLLPEEMNSWKEHIVGCANCQTVLSHLEATVEIPLQAAEEEKGRALAMARSRGCPRRQPAGLDRAARKAAAVSSKFGPYSDRDQGSATSSSTAGFERGARGLSVSEGRSFQTSFHSR